MKKLTIVAAMAITTAAFMTSCNQAPKASLKTDVDTLSYAMGMEQSNGLEMYLAYNGIDTTYIEAFLKGVKDGAYAGDDKKQGAYYAGISIGQQLSNRMLKGVNRDLFGNDSTKSISLKNYLAGFYASVLDKDALMEREQAQMLSQTLFIKIRSKAVEERFAENKKAGEKWLEENKKKEGVKTLPSGVQYKVIREGNGPIPKDTSNVRVKYEGRLIDGTVFDSSYKRKEQVVQMRANQVIKGWTDALVNMPQGSTWEVYIPQELAYGDREQAKIEPFSALVFKIELVEVDPKTAKK